MDATFPVVRLADVAAAAGGRVHGERDVLVRDAFVDSRDVEPGSLFFCIRGSNADGHDFARDAVSAGASGIVAERLLAVDTPQVIVGDVRAAIGPMAAAVFGRPAEQLRLVGLTGTNGKTTSTYLLEGVFRAAGWMPGVIGTTGLRIDGEPGPLARTTPEAPDLHRVLARMLAAGVEAVAIEISSHALAQRRTDGIRVDAAVFTNLSQDHLDFHASMEDYFAAKARLFTSALARCGIVNADDEWGRRLLTEPAIPLTTYGLTSEADLRATDVAVSGRGLTFRAAGVEVRSALRGDFNVSNCLGVLAAALALDLDPAVAADGIASVEAVPGRMEPIDAGQGFAVVVDYAHTPDSILSVLRGARALAAGRVIVVFGCGGDRDRVKRPLMGRAAADSADVVVVTSDNPRSEDPQAIVDEILAGMPPDAAPVVELDRRRAIERAIQEANDGDVVVIAGKGHETTQETAGTVVPFDDRAVARAALVSHGAPR